MDKCPTCKCELVVARYSNGWVQVICPECNENALIEDINGTYSATY